MALFFEILVAVIVIAGLGSWVIFHFWPNRANYYASWRLWFMGNKRYRLIDDKLVEDNVPGRWDYIKNNILKIIIKALIFLVTPLVLLRFFEILGNVGSSILLGFLVATVSSWWAKINFFGKGLLIGAVVAMINLLLPWLLVGTLTKAAWIFFFLGCITYLGEEFSGKNIFPWWILPFCTVMFALNILQMAEAAVTGHNQLTASMVNWMYHHADSPLRYNTAQEIIDFFPRVQHAWAEGSRICNVLRQLAEAAQYIFAGLIIMTIFSSGEMKQWWEKKKKGEKGEKSGGSLGRFVIFDLVIETLLAIGKNKRKAT